MGSSAIVFDGVWKKFRRGERHDSLRDLVPATVNRLLGRGAKTDLGDHEFWAIKDVSFEVQRGEALGIIGPNGAGKSTALKLLTRILRPTRGHCSLHGRVGALIEVAAGFHPDLTGRENIYLQGSIMGMGRADIAKREAEIIDFAGIEAFVDTPVKRYSSGMNARLGFAIAAHLEPDTLIIDEVLSVGDMAFQEKCLRRMQYFRRQGVSMVFVSHNLQAVAQLCDRTAVIARGQQIFNGPTEEALEHYMRASQTASGRHGVQSPHFTLLRATMHADAPLTSLPTHSHCRMSLELECVKDAPDFNIGFEIERSRDLLYCYGTTTDQLGWPRLSARVGHRLEIEINFTAYFCRGHYRVHVNARDVELAQHLFAAENVAAFTVQERLSHDGVTEVAPSMSVRVNGEAVTPMVPA